MSAINGDKARHNRIRKSKAALRERSRLLRKQLALANPPSTAAVPAAPEKPFQLL
jgi:hypothetical protein